MTVQSPKGIKDTQLWVFLHPKPDCSDDRMMVSSWTKRVGLQALHGHSKRSFQMANSKYNANDKSLDKLKNLLQALHTLMIQAS